MADVVAARLTIPVTTNAGQAASEMSRLSKSLRRVDKSLKKATSAFEKNRRSTNSIEKSLGSLKKAFAAIGVGLLVRQFARLTDTYAGVQNKLKLVTNGTQDLAKTQKELFDLSQKSRSSFQSTAELYARLSRSTKALGVSNEDLLTVTDSINKAFIVSGASAEESANAIRQLSQGLAAGALRGDEFNSVAEQAPRLQEAIAQSLGVTVGELRALAAQGKITSEVIVKALKGQAGVIDSEFKQLTPTIGQVATTIGNTFLNLAGTLGQEILPDIAKLGASFITLAKDGGILVEALSLVLKAIIAVAKGAAALALELDRISNLNKVSVAVEAQSGALKRMQKNLMGARKEFGLLEKTRPQIIKALEDIATAENKASQVTETRRRAERAEQYLVALKSQAEVIKKTGTDSNKFLNRQRELDQALIDLAKQREESNNKNIQSQTALLANQRKRVAATQDQSKALALLAEAGDPSAFLEQQRKAFEEQKKIVSKAGLDVATLERFQQQQRMTQFDSFFKKIVDNQRLSFSQRQTDLDTSLAQILEKESLSNEERLAAQQAFNQQSASLEQQRFQSIASATQIGATALGDFNQIANSLSQVRQNQIASEIEGLEDQGASEEVIAQKRKQLQRKAAIEQKRFATTSAILDTAVAVTKALASVPPPGSYVLAGISAAKGAAQLAAIRSQPIPKAQFGGKFEIPPGNEADSGLLRVNQGEQIEVTPTGETGQQRNEKMVLSIGAQEFEGFLTESMQRILNSGKITINRTGVVRTA